MSMLKYWENEHPKVDFKAALKMSILKQKF